LKKSYQEGRSRWTQDAQEKAELKRQLDEMQWARDFQNEYWNNPTFREHMDSFQRETGQPQPQIQVQDPRIQQLEMAVERQNQEREFDRLRNQGLQVSREDEAQVLSLISTNPSIRDVDAAYKKLFFNRELERKAKEAASNTAEYMTETKGSYRKPPTGSQKTKPSLDVTKMSPEEREAAILERLAAMED
jgi:hypothetical protein